MKRATVTKGSENIFRGLGFSEGTVRQAPHGRRYETVRSNLAKKFVKSPG